MLNVNEWLQLILAAPADQKPAMDPTAWLWMLALMAFAFYFIIIRPQRREQQEKQQMLSKVQKGDRVVTIGGIHGKVTGVDETRNIVTIDVGKNVKIDFSRNAVANIDREGKKPQQEGKSDKKSDK
jgi:preprotein translocase subunit YajC